MNENRVICAECSRDLQMARPVAPPPPMNRADSLVVSWLLRVLMQFTYTRMQAEHLMVILRGQTRNG